jgi:metal-sulfur cluster biosynthetic enzyme
MNDSPFPYAGPDALREPVLLALTRVVDPEFALTIVDLGLVVGVTIDDARLHVALTMTSAACPVADLIVDDAAAELEPLAGVRDVDVELVWTPEWTPERMSERARRFMHG